MKELLKNNLMPILFFLALAVAVLWQMLLPGYILSLDMVFAPKIKIFWPADGFYNSMPLNYFLHFLNYFLTGWIVQKIILLSLFFSIGYLAYRFLLIPKKYSLIYWASLFFTVNPFVYERFLAGHWPLLFSYALLPVFTFYLIKFYQKAKLKDSLVLFLVIFLIGIFSLHFLTMALIVLFFYSAYQLIKKILTKNTSKISGLVFKLILGLILFLILSSYWLIPCLLNQNQNSLAIFGQENFEAFKTSGGKRVGTLVNVLSLYGYWGETKPWANYFLWPQDNFAIWLPLLILILGFVGFGIYYSFKHFDFDKNFLFLIILFSSFIFSLGIGDSIFKPINQWLFNNIWFWPGFRDSQKWTGFLVLSYIYFASFGLYGFLEKIKKMSSQSVKCFLIILFLIPILYTYAIWGGFARQLKPIWYPQSWHQANDILNQDQSDFKVLFLPWHQYLSLKFNQNLITNNPAKAFFDKDIIQGENMELGAVYSQGGEKLTWEIQSILLAGNNDFGLEMLQKLAEKGVKYIIFIYDLEEIENEAKFSPKESLNSAKIFEEKNLTIYKIMVR